MPRQILHQPDSSMVLFTNIAESSFTWFWDSIPTTFESGEQRWMERWKARHFCKHLIDKLLIDKDKALTKDQQKFMTNLVLDPESPIRIELETRIMSTAQVPKSQQDVNAEIYEKNLNLNNALPKIIEEEKEKSSLVNPDSSNVTDSGVPVPPKKKLGRPPKPAVAPTTQEETFEGK